MRVLLASNCVSGEYGGLERCVRTIVECGSERYFHAENCDYFSASEVSVGKRWEPSSWLLSCMTRRRLRWAPRLVAERKWVAEARRKLSAFDAVHYVGTGWDLLGFSLQRAAAESGKPITCWPAVHPGSWGDAPLDIDLYQRMDAVFVQSDYEREHLVRLGVPRDKLVRCGCATPQATPGDGSRFRRTYDLGDRPVVLFVGRKDHGKGYHELRKAISQLSAESPEIVLVSIGRDLSAPYPELAPPNELDLGVADEQAKHDALAACDVFALPSRAESFGIVYVEAWAYAKPVLCGTAPASRELVSRHGGGLLTDGSASDVAVKLKQLLSDAELRQELGKAGREAALSEYSESKMVDTHRKVWRQLIEEHALCRG